MATVARAIGADHKWLDNILSHHDVPGTIRTARGVSRRLEPEAVRVLAITHTLVRRLGVPAPRAIAVAIELSSSSELAIGEFISLGIAGPALDADLRERLIDAMETVPVRRRGRPPRARTALAR